MAASERFRQTIANGEVSLWYAALGETLWWIVGLDDHYRRLGDKASYIDFQEKDGDGRTVLGLRYARNFVGHQLTLMLYDPSGASLFASTRDARVTLFQPVWRPSAHLPLSGEKQDREKQDRQRRCYDQYLADQPVRFAIRRARKFLIGRKQELDDRFG